MPKAKKRVKRGRGVWSKVKTAVKWGIPVAAIGGLAWLKRDLDRNSEFNRVHGEDYYKKAWLEGRKPLTPRR